jgi:AAA domain
MSRPMYAVPRDRTPMPVLAGGSSPRCNIPSPPTPLVGREPLIGSACATLRDPDVYWLTMSGPPGVGKTRLALRMASLLSDFFTDGVYFVPLASMTEPALVLSGIVQSLSLKEAHHRSLLDHVKRHLREKHLLLLLDNFEQVTEAAATVSELQVDSPGLKVLATSGTLLHLYCEHDFPVPLLRVAQLRHDGAGCAATDRVRCPICAACYARPPRFQAYRGQRLRRRQNLLPS